MVSVRGSRPELPEGIRLLDSKMFGQREFGGVYLLEGPERALVESGTSHTVGEVLQALAAAGVEPATVRHLLVTHIHLDHAGGAGFLLDHMPQARVVVHERGMRHLADPSRLLESAAKALGAAAGDYGTLKPVPPERLLGVSGGEVLDLGGRELEVIYSPGHARHHVCYLDRPSGALFAGDAAGIFLPRDGRIIPTTPYPEFDLPTAMGTMDSLLERHPSLLLFTHFGAHPAPGPILEEMQEEYRWWDRRLRSAKGSLESLTAAIYDERYSSIQGHPRKFIERIIETNIRGFRTFYERISGSP
jgi:glyoxylase-like metal-dependent hydrolase (beta-lactamase superfamily II)